MGKIKKILLIALIVFTIFLYFWWNSPSEYYSIYDSQDANGNIINYKNCIINKNWNISMNQNGTIQHFVDGERIVLCEPI